MSLHRVAVVGVGLIGGSLALRLHARGLDVVAVDPDPATRELAAAAGLAVAERVSSDRDLVILATPLDAMAAVMREVALGAPDALVIDVGSAKVAVAEAAAAAGIEHRYVGAHPMAGTEQSGFAAADPDLLVGVTWAITHPSDPAAQRSSAAVAAFVLEQFEATVLALDVADHDRAVALVSHAPHVLAHALLEVVEQARDQPAAPHLAAGSFRDGTRVAGRNPQRTFNMLEENVEALGAVVDQLIESLTNYRAALTDPTALAHRLRTVAEQSAAVRTPAVEWLPCSDIAAALASSRVDQAPVLLRLGSDGPERSAVESLDPA